MGAMVLRYFYLLRGSLPRIIELAYWPTMQMLIWGFMSQFLYEHSEWLVRAGGILIAAVLLWECDVPIEYRGIDFIPRRDVVTQPGAAFCKPAAAL